MTKRMLVDATHPEETRVAIVDGNWLSDFDFERASKKELKGNIYLAKVIRIEPSLQAAFVEYGGNRHGFLPFSEIHPDYFRIPVGDRPHEDEEGDSYGDETASDEAANDPAYDTEEDPQNHNHDHDHGHGHAHLTVEERAGGVPVSSAPTDMGAINNVPPVAAIAEHNAPTQVIEPAAGDFAGNPVASEQELPLSEFSKALAQDLGLITDFGAAAANEQNLGEAASSDVVPFETVGGEVAEEERFQRQSRPRYKIQEVVKRRQVMLVQVVKEERGNKGAALTTFLSLAGRYCVLMPNTDHGGGVSRKITNHQDRRRMKEILDQLEIPEGMAVILRTAGMEQEPAEIQRDLEHLLRLWNNIREETLQSTAPTLIYEEANLIKRSMRDMYGSDVQEILVAGQKGHQLASDFMRMIMPDQIDQVKLYEDPIPLFFRYNVEKQIDQLYNPVVQLRSGGYIVINPTEALVSIDVNSGRATRERHIESTALKTNLEAAEEIARQLRLRDLAGLVVIDFIDMEDGRNNAAVERRLKDAMRNDRARLQIGRISPFGLLELSRQRLHPSLMEINFEKCAHCAGMGLVRSIDSASISILRLIEEEGIRQASSEIIVHVPTNVALYLLNQKRQALTEIERRYGLHVLLHSDDTLVAPDCRVERIRANAQRERGPAVNSDQVMADSETGTRSVPAFVPDEPVEPESQLARDGGAGQDSPRQDGQRQEGGRAPRSGRGRQRFGRNRNRSGGQENPATPTGVEGEVPSVAPQTDMEPGNGVVAEASGNTMQQGDGEQRGNRRRGRRGGRGRRPNGQGSGFGGAPREQGDAPRSYSDQGNVAAPVNVLDMIDTTPRETRYQSAPMSSPAPASSGGHEFDTTPRGSVSSTPYQVVENDASAKPKGGWWHRLTGQS